MKSTDFKWDEDMRVELRKVLEAGASAALAAKRIKNSEGRSPNRNSVIGAAHRYDIPFKTRFKKKPTGRKKAPLKAKMPKPGDPPVQDQAAPSHRAKTAEPRSVPPMDIPPLVPVADARRVLFEDHEPRMCACLFDDGFYCGEPRALVAGKRRSTWCAYHRKEFTVPLKSAVSSYTPYARRRS